MNQNNDNWNFFGIRKKNVKPISYIGMIPTSVQQKKIPVIGNVNFIGKPQSFNPKTPSREKVNYWGKSEYKKESINQKRLSKWGDADMDGSPNYFDCDPVDWLKDKKKVNSKKMSKFTSAQSGVSVVSEEDFKKMQGKQEKDIAKAIASGGSGRVGRRRLSREERISRARQRTQEAIKRISSLKRGTLKGQKYAEAEFAAEEAIMRGKIPKAKYIKKLAEAEKRRAIYLAPEEREYQPKIKYSKREQMAKAEKQLEELRVPFATKTELAQMTKKERIRYQRSISDKAIDKMKKKREEALQTIKIEKKIQREKEAKERVEGIKQDVKRVITGKAAIDMLKRVRVSPDAVTERAVSVIKAAPSVLTATYGKGEKVATAKVRRLVKGGLGTAFGGALLQTKFGPAIKGRPSGPSGKYIIEGKPVYEEEYSKWAAEQRALNRLTPSTQQQAPISEETQQQLSEEQVMEQQTQEQYPSETSPMTTEEIQASKTFEQPTKRGPTAEEIRLAQEIAQAEDNILKAPSFMKGELKATGGSLLTSTGPQIMDAPNPFKGELRTLNRGGEVPAVKIGERPQANPYGDEYVEIELGSGKPVLRKRPREKWVTGEAL
jgi:hypothetical protein